MKHLRSIILIVPILVAGAVITLPAQNKAENTSSARAAYGRAEPVRYKAKKKRKTQKARQAKIDRAKSPAYRKRGAWAG
jgi:hypothetical protein